jgi:hypothetical protein
LAQAFLGELEAEDAARRVADAKKAVKAAKKAEEKANVRHAAV